MNCHTSHTKHTWIGDVSLTEVDGCITALSFGSPACSGSAVSTVETPLLREAFRQLDAWLAGELRLFSLPLASAGTLFMREIWQEVLLIPYASTSTYKAVAAAAGYSGAVRAVATACSRNPIPIFIPCHRVTRSDGTTGGYIGGTALKMFLLGLERGQEAEA